MKKIILPILIGLLVLTACTFRIVQGSGNLIKESRDVKGFDRIYLSGIGELQIIQSDGESLVIEAEDNVLPKIESYVEDGTLHLKMNTSWENNIIPTKPIKYVVTLRNINQVNLSGAGSISAGTVKTDQLKIISSGAGSIKIRNLEAELLDVNISGVGNCDINGKVTDQKIDISGTGTYNGEDLESNSANITMSGAGNATIWAKNTLDVIISGAGNVSYYDNPRISKTISGVGNLKELGPQ